MKENKLTIADINIVKDLREDLYKVYSPIIDEDNAIATLILAADKLNTLIGSLLFRSL